MVDQFRAEDVSDVLNDPASVDTMRDVVHELLARAQSCHGGGLDEPSKAFILLAAMTTSAAQHIDVDITTAFEQVAEKMASIGFSL